MFEARALIEPRVAALAAKAAVPEDIALLRKHLEREHEAIRAQRDSEAIMLSAHFHVGIAEIAHHSVLAKFVRELVSHSSLIIALYWNRHDTTCEKPRPSCAGRRDRGGAQRRCRRADDQPPGRSPVGPRSLGPGREIGQPVGVAPALSIVSRT